MRISTLTPVVRTANKSPYRSSSSESPVFLKPFFAPLLFANESSDARDHCANERTFLSWLRLSVYMSVVSVAIVLSFHLKSEPTSVEKKIALPVGLVFWLLSIACLVNGLGNYLKTVRKYARRQALVQSGWKTQVVRTTARLLRNLEKWFSDATFRSLRLLRVLSWPLVCCFCLRMLHLAGRGRCGDGISRYQTMRETSRARTPTSTDREPHL